MGKIINLDAYRNAKREEDSSIVNEIILYLDHYFTAFPEKTDMEMIEKLKEIKSKKSIGELHDLLQQLRYKRNLDV